MSFGRMAGMVNPNIDYRAQGLAQLGQSLGQGIGQAGAGIAQGIQQRQAREHQASQQQDARDWQQQWRDSDWSRQDDIRTQEQARQDQIRAEQQARQDAQLQQQQRFQLLPTQLQLAAQDGPEAALQLEQQMFGQQPQMLPMMQAPQDQPPGVSPQQPGWQVNQPLPMPDEQGQFQAASQQAPMGAPQMQPAAQGLPLPQQQPQDQQGGVFGTVARGAQQRRIEEGRAQVAALQNEGLELGITPTVDPAKLETQEQVNQALAGVRASIAAQNNQNRVAKGASEVAQDYNRDPVVDVYNDVHQMMGSVLAATAPGADNMSDNDDVALVTSFLQMTQPRARRVTDDGSLDDQGNFIQRVEQWLNRWSKGNRLDDDVRRDIINTSKRLYGNARERYEPAYQYHSSQAERQRVVDEEGRPVVPPKWRDLRLNRETLELDGVMYEENRDGSFTPVGG